MFVTGGIGPGVTSSLFQTVYDQDFTLQTANPLFDATFGLHLTSSIVSGAKTGEDAAGKILFPSKTLMMREKVHAYQQFALQLLGDSNAKFVAPFESTSDGDGMDAALFLCFKRLFHRDGIKRETFAMRFYQSAAKGDATAMSNMFGAGNDGGNLNVTSVSGSAIFTDVGAASNKRQAFGGSVGNVVDSSNTARTVGLMFYDRGVAVFDVSKIISGTQKASGTIDALRTGGSLAAGKHVLGGQRSESPNARFVPDFLVSASMDNVIDHFCGARFSSGSLTAMAFQNQTAINSTLVFCRLSPDEFNYSSNPTYVDSGNRITVIDAGEEGNQNSFTMITGVGLYDANDNLLAVAKLSRPIEKSSERDLTVRVRLDY